MNLRNAMSGEREHSGGTTISGCSYLMNERRPLLLVVAEGLWCTLPGQYVTSFNACSVASINFARRFVNISPAGYVFGHPRMTRV